MRVIIFGGSGFLGSHVADALTAAGHVVSVFDRIPSPWLRKGQKMIVGDILNPEAVDDAVKGMDYVYQMAGIAEIGKAAINPSEAIETNIMGSTNIIEACAENDVKRVLFASSVYVYSDKGSFYRVSKQAVESILEAYHENKGLPFTILRYGSLYGPRAQDWNGLKQFVIQAIKHNRIVYPGTGEERREYIHVEDAAKLSVHALDEAFANQCLTITGTQILRTRDVMSMIKEIIGQRISIEFRLEDSFHELYHYSQTPYRYTPKRAQKLVPTAFVDLGQGILEIVEELETEHHQNCCN